ncbi:MAG: diguanylate cyclase, partial [Bdellovibrionales bacterium]|nr:diguanylate cyclase [Bdellovibrionales bacterium]
NKTFIDNRELKPYEKATLRNNDQIRSGNIIFKFFEPGQLEIFSTTLMRDKAQTDSLTGLANRRALNMRGPEFFRKSKSLCLILFDVDKFKDINDTSGHLVGDYVLKQLSSLVMTLVREGDMLFRYGGDEFCLFTRTPFDIAKNISERICHTVEKHQFIYEGQTLPVTISVGVATRTPKDKKWEDVYKRADEASYEAKQAGRNQARFK